MPAGGHVERDECAAEAAVREAREETGLDVRLVPVRARADNHTAERHVHVEHVFLAVAADAFRPGGGCRSGAAAHRAGRTTGTGRLCGRGGPLASGRLCP
jgi:ADP-ribose pyrophosphatase YjhB (NUDIX family)